MENKINKIKWRDLIKDITNEEKLNKILSKKDQKFYIGIDPTAPSMHLGHYISIVLAKILQESMNINPIFVIGGFTGQIGDPSGRNSEREFISKQIIDYNASKISNQIIDLSKKIKIKNFEIFDNREVYEKISILDFFHNYGKNFSIAKMLSKDSVKNRIEVGISYTEFSYQIFQAIDFYYLFKNKNVSIQVGGSDQWGNIVSGIDLISKLEQTEADAVGITVPLLVDENGNKIGKTQGKPIWLDKEKTSLYEMNQYFLNLSDDIAFNLLKKLTIISEKEFNVIKNKYEKDKKSRIPQNTLAKYVISYVHSEKEYLEIDKITKILFGGKESFEFYSSLNEGVLKNITKNLLSLNVCENDSISSIILENNLLKSKRELNEFNENKAIKINGEIINDLNYKLKNKDFLNNKYVILNIGKKNKFLLLKK